MHDQFDVTLEDGDLLGEVELTTTLIIAASESEDHLSQEEIDRLLGCVVEYSDTSFNTILEIGFASAIRREWEWRTEKGLSTDNLAAFAHLKESGPDIAPDRG